MRTAIFAAIYAAVAAMYLATAVKSAELAELYRLNGHAELAAGQRPLTWCYGGLGVFFLVIAIVRFRQLRQPCDRGPTGWQCVLRLGHRGPCITWAPPGGHPL